MVRSTGPPLTIGPIPVHATGLPNAPVRTGTRIDPPRYASVIHNTGLSFLAPDHDQHRVWLLTPTTIRSSGYRPTIVNCYLPDLVKIRRKNKNTFSTSRKIDAAKSGAEFMSFEVRSRWKSNMVNPAKITRPITE